MIFALFMASMNNLMAQCNIIGNWQRINDDGDTVGISIEKDKVIYYINGRILVPTDGLDIDENKFLNHNIKNLKIDIGKEQSIELRSEKSGLCESAMNFKFIDCSTLLIKLVKEGKEAVFYKRLDFIPQ